MAIPGNILSTPYIPAPILPPRDELLDPLEAKHRGGIHREDVSQGLDYQDWRAYMDGDDVKLEGLTSGDVYTLFTLANVAAIDLAFDQVMHPYIALAMTDGSARMWWWNPIAGATEFYILPAGSSSPRIVLDDVRYTQTPASDVLLFYINGGSLMMRRQRDRYTAEYILATGVATILKCGMGTNYRLQFECERL